MRIQTLISLVIVLGFFGEARAQQELETSSASFSAEIEEQDQEQILQLTQNLINRYANFSTLVDRDLKEISLHSEDIFSKLFTANAKIINDLSRESAQVAVPAYLAPIPEAHPRGLRSQVMDAKLQEVNVDPAGNYQASVSLTKIVYQGIEADGIGFTCDLGRQFTMLLDIRIPSSTFDRAYIHAITGDMNYDGCVRQELLRPKLQLFAGTDFDLEGISLAPTDRVRNNGSQSSVSLGAQARYFVTDGLGVHAGLFYSKRDLNVTLNEAAFNAGEIVSDFDGDFYQPIVNLNGARDITSFTQLEIPVGFSLASFAGGKSFGLDVSVVPTIISMDPIISSSKAQFDALYEDLDLYLSGDEVAGLVENPANLDGLPFGVVDGGERMIDLTDRIATTVIKVRLAPYMTMQVSGNISLELGIYYKLSVNDLYEGEPTIGDEITRDLFTDFSVLRDAVETVKLNSYGARLGLVVGI